MGTAHFGNSFMMLNNHLRNLQEKFLFLIISSPYMNPSTSTIVNSVDSKESQEDFALDELLASAVDRGLKFLHENQLPSGSFGCYVAKSKGVDNVFMQPEIPGVDVEFTRDHQLLFPALIIGHSLLFLRDHDRASKVLDKIVDLVDSCRRQGDVWNHSLPGHDYFKMLPDDVDDTSMALSFMRDMGRKVPSRHRVLAANRNEQGLFHTFVTFRPRWRFSWSYWLACARALRYPMHAFLFRRSRMIDPYDTAPALNANVLYYLGKGDDMAAVIKELTRMVLEGTELRDNGLWYRDSYVIHHFISRNFRVGIEEFGQLSEVIFERILSDLRPDGSFNGSAQDTAHAICILLDFGIMHECLLPALSWLLQSQLADGSWPRQAYYYGCYHDMIAAWGGEEMTTAICLEAIVRCSAQLNNK